MNKRKLWVVEQKLKGEWVAVIGELSREDARQTVRECKREGLKLHIRLYGPVEEKQKKNA